MHLPTTLPHETYLKWGICHNSTKKLKMWWFRTESANLIPASRLLLTYLLLSSCITNVFLSSLPDFTVNGWFLMSLLSCLFLLWSMKIICRTVHSAIEIQVDYWRKWLKTSPTLYCCSTFAERGCRCHAQLPCLHRAALLLWRKHLFQKWSCWQQVSATRNLPHLRFVCEVSLQPFV